MTKYIPRLLLGMAIVLGALWHAGCSPAKKQEESEAVKETIKEIKAEKKAEKAATAPAESKPKRTWKDHARDDWGDLGHNLKEDVLGLWSRDNLAHNLIVLGGAGALTAVSVDKWDTPVRRHFDEHRNRLGGWEKLGDVLGSPATHWGVMGLFYTDAKLNHNAKSLETSKRLTEALMLTQLTTLTLKLAVNRERPRGGHGSFPSGHASGSFALAAVLDGMYGHWVGVPLYAVGAFVSLSRMDGRRHHLSDVMFGAALGYVFGRTVTKVHERKVLGFDVTPWIDPDAELGGLLLQRRF